MPESFAEFRACCLPVIAESYAHCEDLLRDEFNRCTDLYTCSDEEGLCQAFFAVGFTQHADMGDLVYLGLSGTSVRTKNSGLVAHAYAAFIADAQDRERQSGRRFQCWGTTATPSALKSLAHLFADVYPHADGGYTPEAAEGAQAIRAACYPGVTSSHPFVLPGAAGATRYSEAEVARIQKIRDRIPFDLLGALGIDERAGDRLLFLARVPTDVSNSATS